MIDITSLSLQEMLQVYCNKSNKLFITKEFKEKNKLQDSKKIVYLDKVKLTNPLNFYYLHYLLEIKSLDYLTNKVVISLLTRINIGSRLYVICSYFNALQIKDSIIKYNLKYVTAINHSSTNTTVLIFLG